jgi:hypothetical protein
MSAGNSRKRSAYARVLSPKSYSERLFNDCGRDLTIVATFLRHKRLIGLRDEPINVGWG